MMLQVGKLRPALHLILILYVIQIICLCYLLGNMNSGSIVFSLGDIVTLVFHGLESKSVELHVTNSISNHVKWSRTLGSTMLEQSLLWEVMGKDSCKYPCSFMSFLFL